MSSLLLAVLLAAAPAGTLVVGTLADPATLEPHRATDIVGAEIVSSVCEPLVRVRPGSLRPEGLLATSWATRKADFRFLRGAQLEWEEGRSW